MASAYRTVTDRKAARDRARRVAVEALTAELAAFARSVGGRFILYGSAAQGRMRDHSDVDLVVDVPPASRTSAIRFAEEACWKLGLTPDVRARDYCSDSFLSRALRDGRVLE